MNFPQIIWTTDDLGQETALALSQENKYSIEAESIGMGFTVGEVNWLEWTHKGNGVYLSESYQLRGGKHFWLVSVASLVGDRLVAHEYWWRPQQESWNSPNFLDDCVKDYNKVHSLAGANNG